MGFPVGSIILWYKAINLRPALWEVCDGTNGTPDLQDKFVYGIANDESLGSAAGTTTHVHANSVAQNAGDHYHDITGTYSGDVSATVDGSSSGTVDAAPDNHSHAVDFDTPGSGNHTHAIEGALTASSLPPFVQVFFIMKVA